MPHQRLPAAEYRNLHKTLATDEYYGQSSSSHPQVIKPQEINYFSRKVRHQEHESNWDRTPH
jgi:hypothetical protein